MKKLTSKSWSPWAVGAAIGVLSWLAFATVDRGLGITTAFESTSALAGRAVAPHSSAIQIYFQDKADKLPKIDWEWMLVVGVFIGAFASSKLSGDRGDPAVPALWKARFGGSVPKRLVGAFLGGALLMFGARLAGGCTSGHGITGALQLAVSSWIFISLAMATGIATAFTLFGRTDSHV